MCVSDPTSAITKRLQDSLEKRKNAHKQRQDSKLALQNLSLPKHQNWSRPKLQGEKVVFFCQKTNFRFWVPSLVNPPPPSPVCLNQIRRSMMEHLNISRSKSGKNWRSRSQFDKPVRPSSKRSKTGPRSLNGWPQLLTKVQQMPRPP